MKYIAADERSGNGDPGEADLELWIVTDYVEKGTFFSNLVIGRDPRTDKMDGPAKILKIRTDEMKNLNHR